MQRSNPTKYQARYYSQIDRANQRWDKEYRRQDVDYVALSVEQNKQENKQTEYISEQVRPEYQQEQAATRAFYNRYPSLAAGVTTGTRGEMVVVKQGTKAQTAGQLLPAVQGGTFQYRFDPQRRLPTTETQAQYAARTTQGLSSGVYVGGRGEQVIVKQGPRARTAGELIPAVRSGPFTPTMQRNPAGLAGQVVGVRQGERVALGSQRINIVENGKTTNVLSSVAYSSFQNDPRTVSEYNAGPDNRRPDRLENFERQILAQERRQEEFYNSEGFKRIGQTGSVLTFGGGRPRETRGFFGRYSESLVTGGLSLGVGLGGGVAVAGEKLYLTGKALTIGDTRRNVGRAYGDAFGDTRQSFKQQLSDPAEAAAFGTQVLVFGAMGASSAKTSFPVRYAMQKAYPKQFTTQAEVMNPTTVRAVASGSKTVYGVAPKNEGHLTMGQLSRAEWVQRVINSVPRIRYEAGPKAEPFIKVTNPEYIQLRNLPPRQTAYRLNIRIPKEEPQTPLLTFRVNIPRTPQTTPFVSVKPVEYISLATLRGLPSKTPFIQLRSAPAKQGGTPFVKATRVEYPEIRSVSDLPSANKFLQIRSFKDKTAPFFTVRPTEYLSLSSLEPAPYTLSMPNYPSQAGRAFRRTANRAEDAGIATLNRVNPFFDVVARPATKIRYERVASGAPGIQFVEANTVPTSLRELRSLEGKEVPGIHVTPADLPASFVTKSQPGAGGFRQRLQLYQFYRSSPGVGASLTPRAYLGYAGILKAGASPSSSARTIVGNPTIRLLKFNDYVTPTPKSVSGRSIQDINRYQGQQSGKTFVPAENIGGASIEGQLISPSRYVETTPARFLGLVQAKETPIKGYENMQGSVIRQTGPSQFLYYRQAIQNPYTNPVARALWKVAGKKSQYYKFEIRPSETLPVSEVSLAKITTGTKPARSIDIEAYNRSYSSGVRYVRPPRLLPFSSSASRSVGRSASSPGLRSSGASSSIVRSSSSSRSVSSSFSTASSGASSSIASSVASRSASRSSSSRASSSSGISSAASSSVSRSLSQGRTTSRSSPPLSLPRMKALGKKQDRPEFSPPDLRKYTPSLSAVFLGIRGAAGEQTTGLSVRPVVGRRRG